MSSASQPANSAIIGSPIAIRNPNRRSPCRQRRRQWRRSVTSRAERLDQHELHDRSDQREQPAEEDSGGDECDDERHHVDREAERELTVRNVSRWRRRVELCRREAHAAPDEEHDKRELQPAADINWRQKLSGDAERFLDVFDCVEGHESKYSKPDSYPFWWLPTGVSSSLPTGLW